MSHEDIMRMLHRRAARNDASGAVGLGYIGGCGDMSGYGYMGGFAGERKMFNKKLYPEKDERAAAIAAYLDLPEHQEDKRLYYSRLANQKARMQPGGRGYNAIKDFNKAVKAYKASHPGMRYAQAKSLVSASRPKRYQKANRASPPVHKLGACTTMGEGPLRDYCDWKITFTDDFYAKNGVRPTRVDTSVAWINRKLQIGEKLSAKQQRMLRNIHPSVITPLENPYEEMD